jgi:single-stranded DNA-specific DHH superfamily exonuclease
LLDAIESCHPLFTRFGGHAHAVGFSLPSASVPDLRRRLEEYAGTHLAEECLDPPLLCDGYLPSTRSLRSCTQRSSAFTRWGWTMRIRSSSPGGSGSPLNP